MRLAGLSRVTPCVARVDGVSDIPATSKRGQTVFALRGHEADEGDSSRDGGGDFTKIARPPILTGYPASHRLVEGVSLIGPPNPGWPCARNRRGMVIRADS